MLNPEMSSPQPGSKGAEISSESLVVSEVVSSAKSQHTGMRRRRRRRTKGTQPSPFKVPDSNSIFLQSVNERADRKEEMRKFLALPIDEKTTHAARMMAKLKKELVGEQEEEEEEEANEKTKNLKQIKSKSVLCDLTSARREVKMAMMKQENMMKDNKHNLIFMERQKAVLELSLMTKRSEISRMDKAIAKEERQLKQLEKIIENDNSTFEEFLRENEKKSVETRTLFEREAKSKQEKNAEIRRLTSEITTIKSELARFEEILTDYKRYKELLFKLSPTEWQEAQKTKAKKAKVSSGKDTKKDQNGDSEETDLEGKMSSPDPVQLSTSETRGTDSELNQDNSEYEDEPELFFTDPQQLVDLMTELTEQNLSLIQSCTRVQETLEELQQSMETTRKKIEKEEEQTKQEIDAMKQMIDKEKARGAKLELKVQLHVSLNTEDEDVVFDALSEKVAEVHRSCVDDRMANLSTLEKLANIENRLSLVLEGLESMPEEKLEMMNKIKDSEKRSKQREEKLREQKEKQKDRMTRYLERSLADSKKISGRKLMPRCMPIVRRVKVSNVDDVPPEDQMNEYLFGTDDTE
ncbi:cilia- and flagella-associated protein 100-like [Mugil cephalus]|uniref:cilia- and flagella-associated protein 100-like n=1 Tax=Mugil cephalus TaxID=48193 RepID=UPI001FB6CCC9|nr:cilia- and flagella-associated protein 100-like [Mugil cephalus]